MGFTHVAKLLLPKNESLKAQVLDIIAKNDSETAKKLIQKLLLKPVVDFTPIVADSKQLAATVENTNKLSKDGAYRISKSDASEDE